MPIKYVPFIPEPIEGQAVLGNFNHIPKYKGAGDASMVLQRGMPLYEMLHLTSKKISLYLPRCLAEIRQHEESQEQYWAREVVWAVRRIEDSGSILTWRKVRDLTNLRPQNFRICLPFVYRCTDWMRAEQISHLL